MAGTFISFDWGPGGCESHRELAGSYDVLEGRGEQKKLEADSIFVDDIKKKL